MIKNNTGSILFSHLIILSFFAQIEYYKWEITHEVGICAFLLMWSDGIKYLVYRDLKGKLSLIWAIVSCVCKSTLCIHKLGSLGQFINADKSRVFSTWL